MKLKTCNIKGPDTNVMILSKPNTYNIKKVNINKVRLSINTMKLNM